MAEQPAHHDSASDDDADSIELGITAEDIRDIAARYDEHEAICDAICEHIDSHLVIGFASLEDVHTVYRDLELHTIDKTTALDLHAAAVRANREAIKLAADRRVREHVESEIDPLVEPDAEQAGDDR